MDLAVAKAATEGGEEATSGLSHQVVCVCERSVITGARLPRGAGFRRPGLCQHPFASKAAVR